VPPPSNRGDARHQRVLDLLRADEMDVAVETAGGEDLPLARDHVGAGPITMVTPGWMSGLPALPIAAIMPSLIATSALTMPQ